jgi:NADH-quinone oxidoreductase subunit J
MTILAQLALAAAILAAAILAVRTANLVRAAVALALGNSSLALLFFLWRAPYAGAAQLSVGAGVLTTLLILAISLTESMRGGGDET